MSESTRNKTRFGVGDKVTCFRRGLWWWAEFYHESKQHRQPLGTTSRKEARKCAARLEAKLLGGSFRTIDHTATIADVFDEYLAHLETEDRAASTLKRYKPELARWCAFFQAEGVVRIADVSLSLVERYRRQRKPQVAAATLYHESVVIKQILNFAHERGHIEQNPLKRLKIKRPKPAPQPTFTLEQVNALVAAGGAYAAVFELLALTGVRIGELRWLTWKDVQLDGTDGGFLYVREKPGQWRPKDGENRKIPLHPRAARLLASLPRRHGFVFTARRCPAFPRGGRQISERHVLEALKRVARRLGIERATVHAFRRFFISFCANNGVEPFKLMRWVGHADIAMVLRYYSLDDDESRRAITGVAFSADITACQPRSEQVQNKHNSEDAMDS